VEVGIAFGLPAFTMLRRDYRLRRAPHEPQSSPWKQTVILS
jgi:hypothetical protein